ncbi:MAG: hypothetical protein AABM43_00770 [Actinomycetota bacterium]
MTNVLGIYRKHGALLRAVVEASTYDEEVGGFWRAVIGRFIDATQSRLVPEGESEQSAAQAKAFALVWGTERACYQQLARGGSLDDGELIGALVEVW